MKSLFNCNKSNEKKGMFNIYNYFNSFLTIAVILLFISFRGYTMNYPNSSIQNMNKHWKIDSLWITIDKVERTSVYPSKLTGPTNIGANFPSKVSKQINDDWDFTVVYFTFSRIEKIHVVSLGGMKDEHSILYDDKGNKYDFTEWSVKGLKLSNPNDFRSSSEFIEGAKGYLVFKTSKGEKVTHLSFVYYFKERLDDKSSTKGQINIDISGSNY